MVRVVAIHLAAAEAEDGAEDVAVVAVVAVVADR